MTKGRAERLGRACYKICRAYLNAELKIVLWLQRKRVPELVWKVCIYSVRLLLLAAAVYIVCWAVLIVGGFWLFKLFMQRNAVPVYIMNERWLDGDALFPDPYSAENMNDAAFYRDK